MTYRRIVLHSRPVGTPKKSNFRIEQHSKPELKKGEVLLKTIYLSLDPYMRGRMNDAESYADPIPLNSPMVGATVSIVEDSQNNKFKVGDWVLGFGGWQEYSVSNGFDLHNLGASPENTSYALGILGMPGFTAFVGLLDLADPQKGETVVVAAATGPVGATVGQIAKIRGCRVVGVAGGEDKCEHATKVLGFDACVNHNLHDFDKELADLCPDGIDVYFESVGGKVFDAVMPLLNEFSRVPVCGLISQYNATELPFGHDRLSMWMATILIKRIKVQGFIISDHYEKRYEAFRETMTKWLEEGKVQYKEQIVQGLEQAPEAFMGLLEGKNFGKLIVQVAAPSL